MCCDPNLLWGWWRERRGEERENREAFLLWLIIDFVFPVSVDFGSYIPTSWVWTSKHNFSTSKSFLQTTVLTIWSFCPQNWTHNVNETQHTHAHKKKHRQRTCRNIMYLNAYLANGSEFKVHKAKQCWHLQGICQANIRSFPVTQSSLLCKSMSHQLNERQLQIFIDYSVNESIAWYIYIYISRYADSTFDASLP